MLTFQTFALSFGLTILFEFIVAGAFGTVLFDKNHTLHPARIALIFLVNLLTNPIAVLMNGLMRMWFPGAGAYGYLWQLVIEALVIITEWLIYRSFRDGRYCGIRRPFLASLLMNGFSYGLGIAVNYFLRRII